jgi:hypothetical protein
MDPNEINELLARAREVLERGSKAYHEALLAVARLEAQRDQMFLASGDKKILVDKGVR